MDKFLLFFVIVMHVSTKQKFLFVYILIFSCYFNPFQSYISFLSMREKFSYSEFFWLIFSRVRIECGQILRISPYSVRMRENSYQKNSEYGHFSRSV